MHVTCVTVRVHCRKLNRISRFQIGSGRSGPVSRTLHFERDEGLTCVYMFMRGMGKGRVGRERGRKESGNEEMAALFRVMYCADINLRM